MRLGNVLPVVAICWAAAPPAAPQDLAATAAHGRNLVRAARLLESGELESGSLEVLAELALSETSAAGLSVTVPHADLPAAGARWTITLVAPAVDAEPLIRSETVAWSEVDTGPGWLYLASVPLHEDFQDAAVVVEDLTSGSWGAVLVELTQSLSQPPPELAILQPGATSSGSVPPTAPPERTARLPLPTPFEPREPRLAGAAPRDASSDASEVIKIVPPAERPAIGRVRVRTIVTMGGIRSAVFYLDGEPVARDDRSPFSATLDLGREPRARSLRVEALGRQDLVLGSDEITLNVDSQPFLVRIAEVAPAADGVRIRAEVSVPPGEVLERVEIFKNEERLAALTEEPFEVLVAGAASPSDFVRAVAYLENGASLEDARLMAGQVTGERIDVNLVEVYAVVSDRQGAPVDELPKESFRLRLGRRPIEIERFAPAEEIPLVLGLIIDSSESMDFLMEDTKRAAARFVAETVLSGDRAFLVDFDTQPRLAQGLTGDVGELAGALGRLRVGGNTAIYDAVIYSLDRFESEPGRRALVLLTDGRDYGSKFSTKRCLQEARRLGVPVYVIAISDLASRMPGAWMQKRPKKAPPADAFLEKFSEATGGRLFSIAEMGQLGSVYETINAELRSQYLLAFSTPKPLTEKELESIGVEIEGPGLSARTVVLSR